MKNFHDKFEDMDKYELEGELHQFLWDDNQDKLLELLEYLYRRGNQFDQALKKTLSAACKVGAVKCVTALINGKPPLLVDIHSPCKESLFPLHMAAQSHHPGITELLLYHGAQTDVRCKCSESDRVYLPLHFALKQLRGCDFVQIWYVHPKESIFTLLIILCFPVLQNLLENIGLLAWKTKETEEEFLHYASDGQAVEAAALLIVARKKLIDLVPLVRGALLTQSNALVGKAKKKVMQMLQLLDVFERAGCEIEEYAKKEKLNVKRLEVITELTSLLQQSGFDVTPQDIDIRRLQWFELAKFTYSV